MHARACLSGRCTQGVQASEPWSVACGGNGAKRLKSDLPRNLSEARCWDQGRLQPTKLYES